MKYFITGTPGSGKTTIGRLLEVKGYEFADSDHVPGLANWYDKETGEVAVSNSNQNADWYRRHDWNWNRKELEKLLGNSEGKSIFVCGVTSNQTNDLDLFDKVFLLKTDKSSLRSRMIERESTSDLESIDSVFEWCELFEKEMLKRGAIEIDANQEPERIVNQILSVIDQE